MNIQQFINNPQLITTLTPQQKLQLYQQIQQHNQQLNNTKIQLQTELQLKQKEQQSLLTQLQQLTNKQTITEIQDYITTLQQQFDNQLQEVITEYQSIQSERSNK